MNRSRTAVWELLSPPSRFGDPARTAVNAHGVRVTMADGATLLCGTSGLWNVNFGYGRSEVRDAVAAALDDASYLTLFRYGNRTATRAAEALLDVLGPEHFGRIIYSTSGSAANDVVMKLARQCARLRGERVRRLVVGLKGSYHGLTYGSHALAGEDLGQEVYGVDQRHVRHVDPDNVSELRDLCAADGDRICAVVVEPVIGTGARVVPGEFLAELGRLADEYGFLVVADEVATGYHRTGPFTASSLWSRRPDVVVLSKGLTNGSCAAAVVAVSHAVCDEFDRHDAVLVHGETQAGTPASAAAILAVLDIAAQTVAGGHPARVAARLDARLRALQAEAGPLLELDGRGCFRGLTVRDADGTEIGPAATMALVRSAREAGAIAHPGPGGLQLIPALVYTDDEVDELVGAVSSALDRHWRSSSSATLAPTPAP
jgi:adenosylmethionine-8-amino-7-oxononanoate aminotransferase